MLRTRAANTKQVGANQDDLLAILIANATHRGVYGMAQISDRSYEHLSTIQANYIRPETLQEASDIINNAVAALPIFRHYHIQEDVLHASTDGQNLKLTLRLLKLATPRNTSAPTKVLRP